MSYNTRRTGSGSGFAPSPNAVGQRRPPPQQSQTPQPSGNYQSQAQTQQSQQQRMQQPQQQQSTQNVGYRTQPPPVQQQQQPPPPQQPIQPQMQGAGKMIVQSVTLKKEEPQPQPQPQSQPQSSIQPQSMETDSENQGPPRRRPAWLTKGNKLPKRERQRRRNLRLRKILQPKNALMILNELVKNATFTVAELPTPSPSGCQYEATVTFSDVELKGVGRSKHAAKAAAAEAALRHVVKYKKIYEAPAEEPNGEAEAMEVTEEDINMPIPWQHIASFALYKLFSSWGEDPDKARQEFVTPKSTENKPPKPLPANAAEMNPVQLLNQMQPQVQYEEIGKSGTSPNLLFTMKCTVDGENYIGTGSNKKLAKKISAYAACSKIYGIQYPKDVYQM